MELAILMILESGVLKLRVSRVFKRISNLTCENENACLTVRSPPHKFCNVLASFNIEKEYDNYCTSRIGENLKYVK